MPPKRIGVVTGGNRGIGFEICRQLAQLDYRVVLTARDEAKGRAACGKLAASGLDVIFHPLDVESDAQASLRPDRQCLDRHGGA